MTDINGYANGDTIPPSPLPNNGRASVLFDASAAGARGLCQVYTGGEVATPSDCVVVSGLTSCVGLLLMGTDNRLTACHFNGGHDKDSEWVKVQQMAGGGQVACAIMIVNKEGISLDWSLLQEGVQKLGAQKVLRYTPTKWNVRIALFGNGTFGELSDDTHTNDTDTNDTDTNDTHTEKGCCTTM
jgi:hypothetical protein